MQAVASVSGTHVGDVCSLFWCPETHTSPLDIWIKLKDQMHRVEYSFSELVLPGGLSSRDTALLWMGFLCPYLVSQNMTCCHQVTFIVRRKTHPVFTWGD